MINVLLDELPDGYECSSGNFYNMDFDFRNGIQASLCQDDPELTETEKQWVIRDLIFPDEKPADMNDYAECAEFYLTGWSHDNPGKKENRRLMDFDIDQWRIYSAFLSQYRIDLNTAEMHWWVFMGLLSSLDECSYTRVIDIRSRNVEADMDKKAKRALMEAKAVYELKQITSKEDADYMDYIDDMLCTEITPEEQERIKTFESYGKEAD